MNKINNIYLGSAPLLTEGGGNGFGSELTNYQVDAYHYVTDNNYLVSMTKQQCIQNYPRYGNKVLRVYYMASAAVSGNSMCIPTFVDFQFEAGSGNGETIVYLVNYQTDYRYLIEYSSYYRTTSSSPVIDVIQSGIKVVVTNVYAISAT